MPVTTSSLSHFIRAAGYAGTLSALILIVNAAKRAALIPTTPATQLAAPLAEVFALALVTGLFLACDAGRDTFGRIAFAFEFLALALLVGVEFTINLVFAEVSAATIAELRAGPLGAALTASSVLFLIGTSTFAVALARTALVPRTALTLFALGAVPVALRAFVPELLLDLGLATLACGVGWLSVWLIRRDRAPLHGATGDASQIDTNH